MTQYSWLGGIGYWQDPNEWAPTQVPGPTDQVAINGYANVFANGVDATNSPITMNRSGTLPVNLDSAGGTFGDISTVGSGGPLGFLLLNVRLAGTFSSTFGDDYVKLYSGSANVLDGTLRAQGGIGAARIDVDATEGALRVSGSGTVDAERNGTITWQFAPPSPITYTPLVMAGTLRAGAGGVINVSSGHAGYVNSFGALVNEGIVDVDAGTLDLNTTMLQLADHATFVHDGGTLVDNGLINSGTVRIAGGTIDFGLHAPGLVGPYGATAFQSTLDLEGPATLIFDSTPISGIVFDSNASTLRVQTGGQTFANLHVTGSGLSQAAFSVSGNDVLYQTAPAG